MPMKCSSLKTLSSAFRARNSWSCCEDEVLLVCTRESAIMSMFSILVVHSLVMLAACWKVRSWANFLVRWVMKPLRFRLS